MLVNWWAWNTEFQNRSCALWPLYHSTATLNQLMFAGIRHSGWTLQCNSVRTPAGREHWWNLLHWQRSSIRYLLQDVKTYFSNIWWSQPLGIRKYKHYKLQLQVSCIVTVCFQRYYCTFIKSTYMLPWFVLERTIECSTDARQQSGGHSQKFTIICYGKYIRVEGCAVWNKGCSVEGRRGLF